MSTPPTPLVPTRVWDLPTRLFHWLLVVGVVGLVITGNVGGNAMVWHARLGVGVGCLLVFRLLWGVVGGRWSRFASFVRSPAALLRYLRGASTPDEHVHVGHNPLGALSVLALLTVLLVQVASGLVSDDEIAFTGPLVAFVSGATSSLATSWHKGWGKLILIGLVVLHVAAIAWYKRKGQNLVTPMITGDATHPADTPASADGLAQRGLALALFLACAAGGAWVLAQGG